MSIIREIQTARILILGCGNVLLGDDGFGPAVIEVLKRDYQLPPHVHAEDVGTSIGEILFDLALSEKRPAHVVLVDTINREGKDYGEVFEANVNELADKKTGYYSLHHSPTSNLLQEVQQLSGIKFTVIAAQMSDVPDHPTMDLSEKMKQAVLVAAKKVYQLVIAQ